MLAQERRQRMLEMVAKNATVSVADFAKRFDTSESTIRRDLERMDAAGLLVKVHGGAASVESTLTTHTFITHEPAMDEKRALHADEKLALGTWAAVQIHATDFVYIDAGTTTQTIVTALKDEALQATYVTNAVSTALALAERGCRVFMLGGELKSATEAIVGPGAVDALAHYNFTKGFWGTNGVAPDQGYTTPDPSEALVKRTSMQHALERYVLADASKLNLVSPVTFGNLAEATLVTNASAPACYSEITNVVEVSA